MEMDKSWMSILNRLSMEYAIGVDSFLKAAKNHVDTRNMSRCPCRCFQNVYWQLLHVIRKHLYKNGISQTYTRWIYHEEALQNRHETLANSVGVNDVEEQENSHNDIDDMLDDILRSAEFEEEDEKMVGDSDHIDSLIGESGQKLYPRCKFSILEFVVRLMHAKVLNQMSNKALDMMLDIMHEAWPEAKIPQSSYDAKKRLRDLGLGYETIHACKYDCAIFWKENASAISCPICHESRYKVNDGKGKRIPHKSLRYFKVKPRLQRLFMSRDNDGALRHLADAKAWKSLDETYPQFSADARNVRLGLASDSFNPFGSMSLSYNMWPVILVPYNLPPWKCMKESFRILSLLIPGPTSPRKDIDVYLRPLIDKLKELWDDGVETYDAVSCKTFQMHAAVMWTINDFSAYEILSGWSTHGYKACPVCLNDTTSKRITSKICYMGHRRYLPDNHRFRRSRLHDGKRELRRAPQLMSCEDVLVQLEYVKNIKLGKNPNNKDYKRKRTKVESNWTKKSIFFELPYWSKLKIRHILDDVLYTILNIEGKTKDTMKARQDLKNMNHEKSSTFRKMYKED